MKVSRHGAGFVLTSNVVVREGTLNHINSNPIVLGSTARARLPYSHLIWRVMGGSKKSTSGFGRFQGFFLFHDFPWKLSGRIATGCSFGERKH
jgi:hypothetical protein